MLLHIKNMVCERCITAVRHQMENLNFLVAEITLGTVQIHPEPEDRQLQNIASSLRILGFELIDKEKDQLVERIKTVIIEVVHYSDLANLNQSLISIIAMRVNRDYTFLSRLFSDSEGLTIEKFIIHQKIEKVKELIEYGELNLNEISMKMGYSSNAHLSSQFKAITGLAPSKYKAEGKSLRNAIDKINN
ncbi:AraC family transcriptional regulator [Pedobacter gandavensis]|uniref:helix-turn-helix domain-containing protein n=1 Tax=Pedobacter gandavensis TaxID=2679963 RepID=UPI00292FB5FD|nr:AraC family transcriptional regulator [Pedobacter gandavensis]